MLKADYLDRKGRMDKNEVKRIDPLLWYEWGDEKEVEITVWTVIKEGLAIKILGRIKMTELPEDAVYGSPCR
jgi:hypothetical protein